MIATLNLLRSHHVSWPLTLLVWAACAVAYWVGLSEGRRYAVAKLPQTPTERKDLEDMSPEELRIFHNKLGSALCAIRARNKCLRPDDVQWHRQNLEERARESNTDLEVLRVFDMCVAQGLNPCVAETVLLRDWDIA